MRKPIKKIALFAVGDAAWQGGIQYITNIIYALHSIGKEHPLEVHLFKNSIQSFPDLEKFSNIHLIIHSVEEEFKPFTFLNRLVWFIQRRFFNRINPRIENLMLGYRFDYVYPSTLADCGKKLNAGAWIADFQYHYFPDGASDTVVSEAAQTISQIAIRAHKIILSSTACQLDCLKLFPISSGKTHVMPFAVYIDEAVIAFDDFDSITEKYSLPSRYILVSNLFAPTKKHITLFDALGILKLKGLEVPLVCTGNIVDYRNQSYANDILQSITKNKIRPQVHVLGLVPRQDQLEMYRMAVALIQPSVSEGWSTSVEEGKALGKNIILSDIAVHKEQMPENIYFFSAMDAHQLALTIETVWTSTSNEKFPQKKMEQLGYSKYQSQVREFGKRFIEIAAS